MFDQLDRIVGTLGAIVGLFYTSVLSLKAWHELAECKRQGRGDQPATKGILMRRIPLPLLLFMGSAALLAWSYSISGASDLTKINGDSDKPEAGLTVIAMPPFLNATQEQHVILMNNVKRDQYAFLSSQRFRSKLLNALRIGNAGGEIRIATDDQIDKAIEQIELDDSGLFNEATQTKIGELLKADVIARGTIQKFQITTWPNSENPRTKTATIAITITFERPEVGLELCSFEYEGKEVFVGSRAAAIENHEAFFAALAKAVEQAFSADDLQTLIGKLKGR